MDIDQLIYVGFNRRVAALSRHNGEVVWDWKCPKGRGFVTLLLDRELLLASVNGYTYALDAATGGEVWSNPMQGFGWGIASVCSRQGSTPPAPIAEHQLRAQQAATGAAAGS